MLQAGPQRVALKITGEFDSVEAIADIGLQANGRSVRLGDVARIYRGYTDPVESKMHFDGKDAIAVRSYVYLALSYDHRIVDGADAARFLSAIKTRLEAGAFEGDLGI